MGINHAAIRLLPAALWLAIIWTAETYVSRSQINRVRHELRTLFGRSKWRIALLLRRTLERVCLWQIQS